MNGRLAKDMRRQANQAPAVRAALRNEEITRNRVVGIEQLIVARDELLMSHRREIDKLEAVIRRGFWGRLKWLCLGR